jgi:hypothetical protein
MDPALEWRSAHFGRRRAELSSGAQRPLQVPQGSIGRRGSSPAAAAGPAIPPLRRKPMARWRRTAYIDAIDTVIDPPSQEPTMKQRAIHQATAFALSALVTLSVLAGLDGLAHAQQAAAQAQLAQAQPAQSAPALPA